MGKRTQANEQREDTVRELQDMNQCLKEQVEECTAELARSKKKFQYFFQNTKDMIFFCDEHNTIVEINPYGLGMLGYPPDKPAELNIADLFCNKNDLETYLNTLQQQGFIKNFEVDFKCADQTIRHVLLTATTQLDDQGQYAGCTGIVKDLTRIKTMMAQLISSEKMASVGQMAAGVAHEINTPLGIILGYAQLMLDDFPKDSEAHENLRISSGRPRHARNQLAGRILAPKVPSPARQEETFPAEKPLFL